MTWQELACKLFCLVQAITLGGILTDWTSEVSLHFIHPNLNSFFLDCIVKSLLSFTIFVTVYGFINSSFSSKKKKKKRGSSNMKNQYMSYCSTNGFLSHGWFTHFKGHPPVKLIIERICPVRIDQYPLINFRLWEGMHERQAFRGASIKLYPTLLKYSI